MDVRVDALPAEVGPAQGRVLAVQVGRRAGGPVRAVRVPRHAVARVVDVPVRSAPAARCRRPERRARRQARRRRRGPRSSARRPARRKRPAHVAPVAGDVGVWRGPVGRGLAAAPSRTAEGPVGPGRDAGPATGPDGDNGPRPRPVRVPPEVEPDTGRSSPHRGPLGCPATEDHAPSWDRSRVPEGNFGDRGSSPPGFCTGWDGVPDTEMGDRTRNLDDLTRRRRRSRRNPSCPLTCRRRPVPIPPPHPPLRSNKGP